LTGPAAGGTIRTVEPAGLDAAAAAVITGALAAGILLGAVTGLWVIRLMRRRGWITGEEEQEIRRRMRRFITWRR
jgi:membrane protein YdbS with pleckstrin-like domain